MLRARPYNQIILSDERKQYVLSIDLLGGGLKCKKCPVVSLKKALQYTPVGYDHQESSVFTPPHVSSQANIHICLRPNAFIKLLMCSPQPGSHPNKLVKNNSNSANATY